MADTQEIEKRIDREVTGSLAVIPHGGSLTIQPRSMTECMEIAKLMSISGICIRPVFRGNVGSCLAIVLQAMKWGADPFAVANKAFVVNDQLSYESQLIHAIVNSSPALSERLRATYSGDGPTRQCLVVGMIRGEAEGREYLSPAFDKITPKNSPLWKTDPDQQLFYYSTRAWARRWVPEILLGIYAPDEVGPPIDLTPEPEPQRGDFLEDKCQAEPEPEPEPQFAVIDTDGVEHLYQTAEGAEKALTLVLNEAATRGSDALAGMWEANTVVEHMPPEMIGRMSKLHAELRQACASKRIPWIVSDLISRSREFKDAADFVSELKAVLTSAAQRGQTALINIWQANALEVKSLSEMTEGEFLHPVLVDYYSALLNNTTPTKDAPQTQGTTAPATTVAAETAKASPASAEAPADDLLGKTNEQDRLVPRRATEETKTVQHVASEGSVTERASLKIAPVTDRGKPDWRAWWVALFMPKLRQATEETLPYLLGNNEKNLESARRALGAADIDAAIKAKWAELG